MSEEGSNIIIDLLPTLFTEAYPVFLAIIGITVYSVFVFKFYRYLATKDIIDTDLSRYSNSFGGTLKKIVGGLLQIVQYILFIPFLVSFWSLVLAFILTLLSGGSNIEWNVLVSTAVVGSVRVIAYYSEDLSRDVAKMLPFALLAVFLADNSSFDWNAITLLVKDIHLFAESFISSLILIALLETILRIIDVIRQIFGSSQEIDETVSTSE